MSYACSCGSTEWSLWRTHTVIETMTLRSIDDEGNYTEEESDFGDTLETGDFQDMRCNACGADAPADQPLWPTKEH